MLDLLVVVVDETFALPRLSGAPSFHGRVHDVRGFSAQLSGDELVAQCVQGEHLVRDALALGSTDFADVGEANLHRLRLARPRLAGDEDRLYVRQW